jgi:Tol biopolymer transport system component/DNA-binding winged helix-turn-helix (wHTH) protein
MGGRGSRIVTFGPFQADLDAGVLTRNGIRLKLSGQPFLVLEKLLSRPGDVVTREELRSAIWQSETYVDFDHGLNTAINKVREALCDSASNPRFVETVPRKGYRFVAFVDEPASAPAPEAPIAAAPQTPRPGTPFRGWMVGALVAGVLVLAAGLKLAVNRNGDPAAYRLMQITRDSGLTHQPSISRDGNFIVYASDRATGKDTDIWFQHATGGPPIRLTSSPDREDRPSISGDGRKVVYQRWGEDPGIYVVPTLGGTPRKLVARGGDPQMSPNGRLVAYSSGTYNRASEIRVISSEGGEPRTVATGLEWAIAPAWTPDGKNLLVWAGGWTRPDYWMVPAAGGTAVKTGMEEQLAASGVRAMLAAAYTYTAHNPAPVASAGPEGVVVAAGVHDMHDLWYSPLSVGKASSPATRVTQGASAAHPSLAATGRIAYSRLAVTSGLWMMPLESSTGRVTGDMRRLWPDNARAAYPHLSADGRKLVYVSNRRGFPDIWLRDLETGQDRQLTFSRGDEFRGLVSPDGSKVVYAREAYNLYTIPVNGGEETLVCEECGVVKNWSLDGKQVIYQYGNGLRFGAVEIATRKKRELQRPTGSRLSPDGRWDADMDVSDGVREFYIQALGAAAGPRIRIALHKGFATVDGPFWSPDGNMIYYVINGALMARRLEPRTKQPIGEPILVKQFAEADKPTFSVNCVAKDAIYFSMEEMRANIWLADPAAR